MLRREENVEIKGKVLLKGTLTLPNTDQEQFPTVLIIPGSGPGDRNGNNKRAKMNLNIYKMLADHLAAVGFASLRYDKRGIGESEGKFEAAGMWDLVDDAESTYHFLKNHPNVDENQIVVLGHSEGCILAPALNERESVSGLILLGGAGCTIEEATKYQREQAYREIEQLSGVKGWLTKKLKVTEKAEKKTAKIFEKILTTDKDFIRVQLISKIPAKWFREHFQYDLNTALGKINCPVLAITGSMDVQVIAGKVHDVQKIVQGKVEAHVIEGMNHVLREQKRKVSMSRLKREYQAQSDAPLHPELIEKIDTWLRNNY